MIDAPLYLGFVLATVVLMLIPGPNWALITANSIAHGTRYGLITVAATGAAVLLQLALTTLGLAAVIAAAAGALAWLRWAGVVYLIWLGVQQWRAPPVDLARIGPAERDRLVRRIVVRGLLTALTNPKTLLFFAAFFPQFISARAAAGPQIAVLFVTFAVINLVIDGLWAVLAGRARRLLAAHARARNRMTGGLLVSAGVGLALARR